MGAGGQWEFPNFGGLYGSASWFLTGETRPYDRENGCFTRVIPLRNFSWCKGRWGAWEIGTRYSFVNLSDEDVRGGRLLMLMAGLNWYPHSHVKWRLNYGFGHMSNHEPAGDLHLIQTRFELDF